MKCGGTPRHKRVRARGSFKTTELEEVPMRIVCALDVHRRQITYAIVDVRSGEMSRADLPADRRFPAAIDT